MFGRSRKAVVPAAEPQLREAAQRPRTVLSGGAEMCEATLVVPEEDVEVNGRWTGQGSRIVCDTLYVQTGAVVEGTVVARRVRVAGCFHGEVTAMVVALAEGASLDGKVSCRSLRVHSKARLRAAVACQENEIVGEFLSANEPLKLAGSPAFPGLATAAGG